MEAEDRGQCTEGATGPISPSQHTTKTPEAQELRNNGVWFKHENKALDARLLYHQNVWNFSVKGFEVGPARDGAGIGSCVVLPAEDSPSFKWHLGRASDDIWTDTSSANREERGAVEFAGTNIRTILSPASLFAL